MFSIVIDKIRNNSVVLRNMTWSLSAQIFPFLALILCIPVLVSNLGPDKFGVLSIAWMIIGYFSLFDLGLGRAVTYMVSKLNSEHKDATNIVKLAMLILILIAFFAFFAFYFLSRHIAYDLLGLSEDIVYESFKALEVLSFGLPFVILSAGLRGVLEGCYEFKKISLITMPIGTLFFLAPTITTLFLSNSLVFVFLSLVIVRGIQFSAFLFFTNKLFLLRLPIEIDFKKLKELFVFSGWITVSNVVSPIMVNMDRFFIGAKLAISSVTYYVVPLDMITKILILPGVMSSVLFPEFSRKISAGQIKEAKVLLRNYVFLISLLLIPLLCFFYIFSYDILKVWISEEFALKSYWVLRIICIGVFFNGISFLPYAFIQGAGRSDITAKFHLFELIIYIPALLYLMDVFGLVGVAVAWALRVFIDFLLLYNYSSRYI